MAVHCDVLMVGHFAKDELIVDGIREIASGGGVYYGSLALRQLGLTVAVVTRLHPDDFPRLDELKNAGIRVFAKPASQTSGIANFYNSKDMERRTCKPIGFAGKIEVPDIPEFTARAVILAGIIAGEVGLDMIHYLATIAPVGLDVQGFVRVPEGDDLVFKPWHEMAEGLKDVTYLKVDRAEAEYLTGETDLHLAAKKLADYGPKEIIITESRGPTVYADDRFYFAPFSPRSLAGRTGRGDTCFSTYIGKRLSYDPDFATKWAAAVTTLKQERTGPWMGPVRDAEFLVHQMSEK